MASRRTPAERSEALEKAERRARKSYKSNLKKRANLTDDEMVVVKDMVVVLKLVAYTNTQIGAIVGLSRGQVKEILADGNVQKRLTSLKEKMPEAAIRLGQAYLVEAVQSVAHVMRTETDNALVLKAAAEIFDRFGVPKLSRTETKVESPVDEGGSEIAPSLMSKLRAAPPEIQEQVAALHEGFTDGIERILNGGKLADSNED